MKRVIFTEEQLTECLMQEINEDGGIEGTTFNTGNFDNMSTQKQIEVCRGVASDNPGMKVTYMGHEIDANTSPSDLTQQVRNDANSVITGGISEGVTKKQLKEARLKYLKENSYSVRKKDLK